MASLAQVVFIVKAKLFKTRAGDIRQLEFGFLRRTSGLTTLRDILKTGPRGLDHLIAGAALQIYVSIAESYSNIVNQPC